MILKKLFKPKVYCIKPYLKFNETYGMILYHFDDHRHGLYEEPFDLGIGVIIKLLAEIAKVPFDQDFNLIFANRPFADAMVIDRLDKELGGVWYGCKAMRIMGWLCPVLFK